MKDLIQKAIDALEYHTAQTRPINKTDEVIAELKSALSAVPAQEPIAWISNDAELPLKEDGKYWLYTERNTPHLIPLYIKQNKE